MADDDYSDFAPVNPEADVAQLEGSDYSEFIPEPSRQSGAIRMASEWVPGERQTHDTQFGPDNRHLVFGTSAAVSPNLAQGHQLHEPFEVYRNGKSLGRYSYDDASYYSPGRPTTNTVERYGLPDLGKADSIKWLGSGGAKDDYSGFIAQNQQPSGQDDYSGFDPAQEFAGTDHPQAAQPEQSAAKPQQANPWDVGKFLQTFVGSGVQQLLKSEQGQAESQLHPETQKVLPIGDDVQRAKEDAILRDPNTSREEADDIIHQRNQRLAYQKANAQQNVEETTAALKEAESRVDQRYEATPQGQVARTLGTGGASLIPGLTGPFAPMALATQMGGQTYAEEKDRAAAAAKKAHPEWSDDQIDAASSHAAENAATTSAESGIVLSLLPVPKIGGLLARSVERIGMRGTYMAVAGAVQDISANKELQNIDPSQALYDGVLARMPANFVAGGAFELPGAIGEAVTGRPNAAPESTQLQQTPIKEPTPEESAAYKAEPQQTPREQVPPQPAITKEVADKINLLGLDENSKVHRAIASLAAKYDAQGIEKFVISAGKDDNGNIVVSELGHGDIANKFAKQGVNPDDNVRYGFLTNKGRFIRADESVNMSGEAANIRDQAREERKQGKTQVVEIPEQVTKPEQTPEDMDKWVSAIANRFSQERSAQGEIGEIAPGEGYSPSDLLNRGLQMSPEEINRHVSDLMHDTGDPKLQAAAIRAEEARLSQNSAKLSRVSEENPNDQQARQAANDAFDDLTDFHNGPVAKLKNNWHAQGMTLQGELPVDLSTFNGIREAWLRDVGTRINPSLEMKMRNTASKVRNAVAIEDMAMEKLGREIERPTRQSLPSDEEVRNNIIARMKDEPCRI